MLSFRNVVWMVIGVGAWVAAARAQVIVQGPVTYSANGHRYYVVQGQDWDACEAAAQAMGGHLATIDDGAENTWVSLTFSAGGTRKLFIGLSDAAVEGTYRWSDGSAAAYRDWAAAEPSSADYVVMQGEARWYARPATFTSFGVVEIAGPIHVPAELSLEAAVEAIEGDVGTHEIEIAPGVYSTSFMAASTPGRETCVIRGAGSGRTRLRSSSGYKGLSLYGNWILEGIHLQMLDTRAIVAVSLDNGRSILRDCVIEGVGSAQPIGVTCDFNSGVILSGCVFRHLEVAVRLEDNFSPATASNCEFTGLGVVVYAQQDHSGFQAVNCTIADIGPSLLRPFEGAYMNVSLTNCIVWNAPSELGGSGLGVSYSNVQGGFVGPGNISADPGFVGNGNYRLTGSSPCIDAGNGDLYVGGVVDAAGSARIVDVGSAPNRVRGSAIDMGCYEVADAGACGADFNHDGVKNSADFFDFLTAFFSCP